MSLRLDDTIAAVATAPGGAACGVVRIAGPGVVACLESCFRTDLGLKLTSIRRAAVIGGRIALDRIDRQLPCEVYLWPTEKSYTRSPLAEVHTLGSPPLLEAVLRTVCRHGARVAEPGEFTLRAFLAGRLDLAQAEAVLGVIDARGDLQLKTALEQLSGGLSGPLHRLRESLLELLSELEAGLDFAEEDIEPLEADRLRCQLAEAAALVQRLAGQMRVRHHSASATRVVLAGLPNVGKSSLFNALVAEFGRPENDPPALVSPESGTTRDYLSARVSFGGMVCHLIDTAGLEEVDFECNATPRNAAQRQAERQHRAAEVRLWCVDASQPLSTDEHDRLFTGPAAAIVVLTKCDLPRGAEFPAELTRRSSGLPLIETSSTMRQGLSLLAETVARRLADRSEEDSSVVAATAERCRESLAAAETALERAAALTASATDELVAAEIRVALVELGRITGAVYTDDILDRIFSRFCIGK